MDSGTCSGGTMVESDEQPGQAGDTAVVAAQGHPCRGNCGASGTAALHQCELLQNMIDISILSLQGLRTKCAASNDLTQQEIRTLEVKLMQYICKQLQCKRKVPASERPQDLEYYPRLEDWLRIVNLRPEVIEAVPGKLSLDTLLQMSGSQVRETMRRLGSNSEECSRLTTALSCLRSATESGGELRDDGVPWISEPVRRDSGTTFLADQLSCLTGPLRPHSPSPLARPPGSASTPSPPGNTGLQLRSVSVSTAPSSDGHGLHIYSDSLVDPFPSSPRTVRAYGYAGTPPITPPSRRRHQLKPPRTPPAPSRKLLNLLPNITLTRSRSHESQLGNRIEDPPTNKCAKKNKLPLKVQINGSGGGCEDSPLRSPLLSARTPGALPTPATAPYTLPGTPTLLEERVIIKNNVAMHRSSPQTMRRDIGLPVTHRFSTKSWLSQTCQVCQKNMMFGVKCKHCRLKCHNKCTKEAPSCRISFLPIPKIRRTESVPSDINNPTDRPTEPPQFGTLPKAITKKDHPPTLNQLDSSSNPSSTTSSTPSSPAPFQQSNPPSATPPPNPSPKGPRDNRFHFPAACYFQHRQQFIFPDVPSLQQSTALHCEGPLDSGSAEQPADNSTSQLVGEEEAVEEEEAEEDDDRAEDDAEGEGQDKGSSDGEADGDELDDLPSPRGDRWKGPISRKASQTSVYLQEWDIPFEQLDLGELIGKGRWGKVHRGRWHGEVAIRLLEIDGNNQDHLKLFKKEVMNYRQTRHENVVLFMGACMAPPHLAIITSFCKGRTLYSVVRDAKNTLDINKTRQIAQEIVKGMGYLHAKGIVHKDLKSKNVFYDSNKVVITDFGLFGISGVVQEGRRENELKVPHGWICYLAPEIVRQMGPGNNEDRLPFSNAADVYAFGTVWYELQARDWPFTRQPVEATIWQVGSGQGIKKVLAEISMGKEVTEILSACWSYNHPDRPTFTQLADMLEKLPKLNRRLSHPGHFWKSAEL
ncbi:kinase suppressor of Ras 1-like isoform X2 [Scleropages formosus]|uniref:non-specific serine/threonine protein kinase n=1 Tax=Scleropages formosus TaxID=113540 RepID=A0A8C9TD35_SCLFO|nr:kinase suppressor of Ras 1-like isoform X2 [Scleropages formosus]